MYCACKSGFSVFKIFIISVFENFPIVEALCRSFLNLKIEVVICLKAAVPSKIGAPTAPKAAFNKTSLAFPALVLPDPFIVVSISALAAFASVVTKLFI